MAKAGGKTVLMTEGPLIGILIAVAAPITMSNVVQSSYNILNAFFVGHLGANAVAAVAASGPLFSVLMSLGSGLSTAGSVLIAQNAGARRMDMLDHVAAQTLLMVFVMAVGFALIGSTAAPHLLDMIGVEPEVRDLTARYLAILYVGMVPMFLFLSMQAMLQAVGEVRFAMIVMIASIVLNGVLDPLLIFGIGGWDGFGVIGAAIATVISQVCAFGVVLWHLLNGRSALHLHRRQFKPDLGHMRLALGLGLPASIEQGVRTFSSLLLMALTAQFGTKALATFGLGTRVLIFFFTPIMGLSIATAAVVGQNIGAGQHQRARDAARIAAWLGFLGLTAIGLALIPAAPAIMRTMVPDEPEVIASASTFAYIYLPFLGVLAVPQILLGAFRGAGSTRQSMTISVAMQWLFQLPTAGIVALLTPLGVLGVWWSYPIGNLGALALCILWFRYGPWMRKLVGDKPAGS